MTQPLIKAFQVDIADLASSGLGGSGSPFGPNFIVATSPLLGPGVIPATLYSWAHGLGGIPNLVQVFVVNNTLELGYVPGEVVSLNQLLYLDGGTAGEYGITVEVTPVSVEVYISLNGIVILDKTAPTGPFPASLITPGSWDLYIVAAI